ncbi:MAG TPA: putative maltokinase [Chthoniobacteraceae bacterium]|nr:putative maltokinase [Chthoniobacteraceae bacterium]
MHESEQARLLGDEPLDATLFTSNAGRRQLETRILPRYLQRSRWFAGKARRPTGFVLAEMIPLGAAWILVVDVRYADGASESYLVPLALAENSPPRAIPAPAVAAEDGSHILYDAIYNRDFRARLIALLASAESMQTAHGSLVGTAGNALADLPLDADSRVLAVEQSNSSVIYDERLFLKLYRKLEPGVNPDAEITRFLSEEQKFAHVPPFGGSLELRVAKAAPRVIALATGVVENRGDAWSVALQEVEQFYERARTASSTVDVRLLAGNYLERAHLLGRRTGEMHAALGAPVDDPRFGIALMTSRDLEELAQSIEKSLQNISNLLRCEENPARSEAARAFLGAQKPIADFVADLRRLAPNETTKIRTHGDYHLGQVLDTGNDFVIIDFEGEPLRPLAWRQEKRSPLRDVAGMLRSFEYAAYSRLEERSPDERALVAPWTRRWVEAVGADFLGGWKAAVRGTPVVSHRESEDTTLGELLRAYLIEKALYEIGYELSHRPDWVGIPVAGILALVGKN